MFFREKLKRLISKSREDTPVLFYTTPQTYSVRYRAMVKNKLNVSNSCTVILPVPLNTAYQQLTQEPRFFPEHTVVNKDVKFGNRYVSWRAEFAPNESKIFKEEFTVIVSPRKAVIDESLILDDYLSPRLNLAEFRNTYIDGEDERVKRIVRGVVGRERRISEILRRLNAYVITRLSYGDPITGLYSSQDACERDKVDCGGFDTLLAAFCIASGIPARIISGFWAGYDKNEMHAWLEIMLPSGEWIPADPSVEHLRRKERTQKAGELGFIGSDRIAFSIGCEIPIKVGDTAFCVDILQNPLVISDKPTSFLLERSISI